MLACACAPGAPQAPTLAEEVAAFAEIDRASPPPAQPVVFVGSSSIRRWTDLEHEFEDLTAMNRGFGGSQTSDAIRFVDELVNAYAPRAVVVYEGDNDLDASTGKTADDVFAAFRTLVERIHAKSPAAHVYFLAIKPSKLRWARWPEMDRANALIRNWSTGVPAVSFIDVATPLLGANGRPRDDVFLDDGLHLNETGYALWAATIGPVLRRDLAANGG